MSNTEKKLENGNGSDASICSVWIVAGETGEYSDYSDWNVAAFHTEEMAESFKDLCQNEADKANKIKYGSTGDGYASRSGSKHSYDTQFYCNYTGTDYRVELVEILNVLPNVKGHPSHTENDNG